MKYDSYLLGGVIRKNREELGLSKRQLARGSNISDTELTRIETGEREVPNIINLDKICEILGLNTLQLLIETHYFSVDLLEDLFEKYDRKLDKNYAYSVKNKGKIIEDFLQWYQNYNDDNPSSNECNDCQFYCPHCGNCTYED